MTDDEIDKLASLMGERREASTFERHAQTILAGLITILLAGAAGMVFNMNSNQAIMVSDLKVVQYEVKTIREALRQNQATYITQSDLDVWRKPIELRLETLEEKVANE